MSIVLMPRSRLPAYCTSVRMVLLAALPVERPHHSGFSRFGGADNQHADGS
jgi:DNA-binding IclR family transcriptional regulator